MLQRCPAARQHYLAALAIRKFTALMGFFPVSARLTVLPVAALTHIDAFLLPFTLLLPGRLELLDCHPQNPLFQRALSTVRCQLIGPIAHLRRHDSFCGLHPSAALSALHFSRFRFSIPHLAFTGCSCGCIVALTRLPPPGLLRYRVGAFPLCTGLCPPWSAAILYARTGRLLRVFRWVCSGSRPSLRLCLSPCGSAHHPARGTLVHLPPTPPPPPRLTSLTSPRALPLPPRPHLSVRPYAPPLPRTPFLSASKHAPCTRLAHLPRLAQHSPPPSLLSPTRPHSWHPLLAPASILPPPPTRSLPP